MQNKEHASMLKQPTRENTSCCVTCTILGIWVIVNLIDSPYANLITKCPSQPYI